MHFTKGCGHHHSDSISNSFHRATSQESKDSIHYVKPSSFFEVQVFSGGSNVALDGTSSQSTTFKNASKFSAYNANDNSNITFSHTNAVANSWWEVDSINTYDVESVVVLNRWCVNENDSPACLCRLTNAVLQLYNQSDHLLESRALSDTCEQSVITETFTLLDTASNYKVRLESTNGEPLQMFEVQVYSGDGNNIALQGSASQSSTLKNLDKFAAAINSIDDDNSTFSHTQAGEADSWWEVDLKSTIDGVQRIEILNRNCGKGPEDPLGCLCRLSQAKLILLQDGEPIDTRTLGNTCNVPVISESFGPNIQDSMTTT
jgi:hypothetical protein